MGATQSAGGGHAGAVRPGPHPSPHSPPPCRSMPRWAGGAVPVLVCSSVPRQLSFPLAHELRRGEGGWVWATARCPQAARILAGRARPLQPPTPAWRHSVCAQGRCEGLQPRQGARMQQRAGSRAQGAEAVPSGEGAAFGRRAWGAPGWPRVSTTYPAPSEDPGPSGHPPGPGEVPLYRRAGCWRGTPLPGSPSPPAQAPPLHVQAPPRPARPRPAYHTTPWSCTTSPGATTLSPW